ncbi:MAG: thioredoxin family protein [bacterium]
MQIQIFGTPQDGSKELLANTNQALSIVKADFTVEYVEDQAKIAVFGKLKTPIMTIEDEIVLAGGVPTVEQLASVFNAIVVAMNSHSCCGCHPAESVSDCGCGHHHDQAKDDNCACGKGDDCCRHK